MNRPTTAEARRGIVPILALVLLIGVVATASIGIFLVATSTLESTEQQAQADRVESAFVQFSNDINTVTASSGSSRQIDLATEEAVRKADTGRIIVTVSGEDDPIVNESIGSIEYEADGSIVAYQAGGVWRGTGSETRMVSAPQAHYRTGSLTFPIMSVDGEEQLSSNEIRIRQQESRSALDGVDFVEGKLVTVEIESEYYLGWAEFFETRTGEVAVSVDHESQTTTVDLGRPLIDGNFDDAIVAQGSVQTTNPNACIDGTVVASGSITDGCNDETLVEGGSGSDLLELDEAIEITVEETSGNDSISGNTIDSGTYFVDGDLYRDGKDLTLDVSEGNITVVVDGHVALDNSRLTVETGGTDNTARLYTTGDVAVANGDGAVEIDGSDSAKHFQLYGTSQMHFGIGQGEFTGTVYAPRNQPADGTNEAADKYSMSSAVQCEDVDGQEPDVCIGQGNVEFTGSIVAGPMSIEENSQITYDPLLQEVEPTLALENAVLPPPLTHMQVVVYDVDVTNER